MFNLKIGIVGLPNVGKSTLFNAITKAGAQYANYPFCTLQPPSAMALGFHIKYLCTFMWMLHIAVFKRICSCSPKLNVSFFLN